MYDINICTKKTLKSPICNMGELKTRHYYDFIITSNWINPFSHSGHCIGPPSKISILV